MIINNSFDNLIFYRLPSFLFCLLPVFLITGPFLSDLAVSLIAILFLVYCFKIKNFSSFKNKYFYFFLTFYIYLCLNSFLNNFNLDSLKISVFYFRFGIFVIAIIALLEFDKRFLKFFFYILLFCFIILIADGFWQYFFGINLFGMEKAHEHRISSFFGEELILGSYLSRLFPILFALGYYFYHNKKFKFSLLIVIFVLSEILIFLSGERTSFFFINLSALFIIFFSKNLKLLRMTTLLISIVMIFFISLFDQTAKKRIIDKTFNEIVPKIENNINENGVIEKKFFIFSKHHTHHYISAYRMFKDNIIFGLGVKNFRNFCHLEKYNISELSCSTHPHNTYLQLLTETGITGFSFLFFLLILFSFKVILHCIKLFSKSSYFNDFQICLLSGILITLWPFVPSGNFFNNWLSIIYYLSLPIFFWSVNLNSYDNKASN